ncbi:MAG TPA: OmpA family protein [Rhizobiaceae bacterium]|nr:OmpA family protein [Rhizobiaceae bacterium]
MKCQTRILAGTAIGLFMASGAFAAAQEAPRATMSADSAPVVLAQAEGPATKALGKAESTEQPEAAEQEAPSEASQSEREEPAAEETTKPTKKRRDAEAQQPSAEEPGPKRARDKAAPEPKMDGEPTGRAAEQRPAEGRAKKRGAAEEAEPARRPDAEEPTPRAARQKAAPEPESEGETTKPADEQPSAEKSTRKPGAAQETGGSQQPKAEEPGSRAEQTPEKAPSPEPAPEQPTPEKAPEPSPAPAQSTPKALSDKPARAPQGQLEGTTEQEQRLEKAPEPTQSQDAPAGTEPPEAQPGQEGSGAAAPVLDSQKRRLGTQGEAPAQAPAAPSAPAAPGNAGDTAQPGAAPGGAIEPSAPPADDGSAQREVRPAEIQPVTAEEGRRIERRPEDPVRERPQGAEVVREIGDRVVIEIDNQVMVESNDRPRIAHNARDVYYEELPRGRNREVILREDGSRVVTIRNRYGDVIRRSRITPDDREYVLVYVEDADFDRVGQWRDPGLDLPPLQLTVPEDEYILDAEQVDDPDVYYEFLEQPPVERVERLYSIDEVKRSARIRDKTRRVDLDTITFEFGSAAVPESEVRRLEGVAKAMEKLLDRNPAETFLIEGHTDAVGSDVANLALSDERAESVAEALTNVFGIPPENLSTQGYGEQYLKVNTEEPERQNRRVAIRRITPLVAPVASAK